MADFFESDLYRYIFLLFFDEILIKKTLTNVSLYFFVDFSILDGIHYRRTLDRLKRSCLLESNQLELHPHHEQHNKKTELIKKLINVNKIQC